MNEKYIEFRNISKVFPGQQALKNVSFSIRKGEIHALVGENGAGKSTLLNILNGVLPQTAGDVIIDGEEIIFSSPQEAIFSGIVKVHQEIILVPEMTVMDNLFLGFESTRSGLLNRTKIRADTQELLDKLKCKFSPDDRIKDLNVGEKQMLQIAKALHLNARVISFDEPTSSLTNNEVDTLFSVIRQLQENGMTILYITHKLDEIYQLCDRATILRDGEYIGTYDIVKLTKEDLIRKMVGRDVSMFAKRIHPSKADWDHVVLRARNLSGQKGYRDVSFDLHKGEILGFYGLVGAKRTETMLGVFGADVLTSGTMELNGKPVVIRSPNEATRNSIGLVPENRKEQGFVKDLKNLDNICLASLDKFEVGILQNSRKKFENTKNIGKKVGLLPNDPYFYTSNLSGGNQQKVIIAKWLSTQADILIFDEPTKGIDVGSKSEIYHLMEELVSEGKSIIMISGELPEIIGMADRIVVMRDGEVSAILPKEEFDETKILAYAVGGKINELQETV
jgi:ABC-type sugar transport system ATPase subunit